MIWWTKFSYENRPRILPFKFHIYSEDTEWWITSWKSLSRIVMEETMAKLVLVFCLVGQMLVVQSTLQEELHGCQDNCITNCLLASYSMYNSKFRCSYKCYDLCRARLRQNPDYWESMDLYMKRAPTKKRRLLALLWDNLY